MEEENHRSFDISALHSKEELSYSIKRLLFVVDFLRRSRENMKREDPSSDCLDSVKHTILDSESYAERKVRSAGENLVVKWNIRSDDEMNSVLINESGLVVSLMIESLS